MQNVKYFCELRGVKPTIACTESGAGRNLITDVKNGKTPSVGKVQMLASYLGVTTSQLLGESEPAKQKDDSPIITDEEAALDEELVNRLCQLNPEQLAHVDALLKSFLGSD